MNYFDKFPQYKYKIDNKHLTINGRKMNIRYITFVEHIELQLLTLEEYHILESTHLEYELRRAEQSAPTDHPLPSYDTPAPPAVTSPTAVSDMYVKGCYLGSKESDRDLKRIADSGNHLAEGFYSLVYHVGGAETQNDDDSAAHYSNRALPHLSTSSSREAMFVVASIYDAGIGTSQDVAKAFSLYRKAANLGYAPAQCCLGVNYQIGNGVAQDVKVSNEWYLKAASQGYAPAQCCLGFNYQYGLGVAEDVKVTNVWYLKAGHADIKLGFNHLNGNGFPKLSKDLVKAKQWYSKAADQGYKDAINALKSLSKSKNQ